MTGETGLELLDTWPAEHRAAGWLTRSGATAAAGERGRVFATASVTKLLTATAVLVAVQEEVLDLDEPAGPPGSTVRLLLCHASGLFDEADPVTAPGQRRIYGSAAYDLLGDLVAARSGIAFPTYLDEAVLQPLDMAHTVLEGSPGSGASSSVDDLLRFSGELLAPGRVLAPETLAEATTVQLPDLAGVLPGYGRQAPNPWGLGFEVRGAKSPHWTPVEASPETFGHFGQTGCFLWVDPRAGMALVALTDLPFGDWALAAWPALGQRALRHAAGG